MVHEISCSGMATFLSAVAACLQANRIQRSHQLLSSPSQRRLGKVDFDTMGTSLPPVAASRPAKRSLRCRLQVRPRQSACCGPMMQTTRPLLATEALPGRRTPPIWKGSWRRKSGHEFVSTPWGVLFLPQLQLPPKRKR